MKEGKLGRREGPMPGENEPLHAYVTGMDTTIIKRACEKVFAFFSFFFVSQHLMVDGLVSAQNFKGKYAFSIPYPHMRPRLLLLS